MNPYSPQLENLHASNRAMGVFAGVTSEVYERIGFGHSGASLLDTLLKMLSADMVLTDGVSDDMNTLAKPDSAFRTPVSPELQISRVPALEDENPGALQVLVDGVAASGGLTDPSMAASPSLMDDLQDWSGSGTVVLNDVSTPSSSGFAGELGSSVESLTSSLFDLLNALSQESSGFSEEFDGERQRLIRDFIDDLGQRFDSGVRDFLQNEVRGETKNTLQGIVDSIGVDALDPVSDPLFSIDYYGESATLINGTLNSGSGLSSVALPPIGPTFTALTEQLVLQ